jgi:hypothetical protein
LKTPRAAAIAFSWFIGVLRDRLGELEDRFFATVLLGSGLLFLVMLSASAAVAGGIIIALPSPCLTLFAPKASRSRGKGR